MTNYIEHQQRLTSTIAGLAEFPANRFTGRGIVICAGGETYLTGAYLCIRVLHLVGCKLPIQVWHRGTAEMPSCWRTLLKDLGIEIVNAIEMTATIPCRILNGWELKCYALLNSRFKEVLLLDADNIAVRDPEYLFDAPQYLQTGAIFWPDRGRLGRDREIWKICEVPYRNEPEFESGQMVIDKSRCWKPLQIAMHLNEWSDFYYHHIHGDKDTFHMAWRKLEQPYAMAPRLVDMNWQAIYQHDLDGRKLFQHRSGSKWDLYGANPLIPGFAFHAECLAFLDVLKDKLLRLLFEGLSQEEKNLYHQIVKQRIYLYARSGHNSATLTFLPNMSLNGAGVLERRWTVENRDCPTIIIHGDEGVTCKLAQIDEGVFVGRWLLREQMPIALIAQRS